MLEIVEARKDADKVEERYDLLSGLLDAAQDEPGSEAALSDDELMGWYSLSNHSAFIQVVLPSLLGNMFIFLLAGHEVGSFPSFLRVVAIQFLQTTAHTLCFSFALLALYPDEQERLYQHIKGIMSSLNRMPVGSWNLKLCRANISVGL
jgi:hypothetical protein